MVEYSCFVIFIRFRFNKLKWLILCRERYLTRDGMKYNKEKAKKEHICSFFVLLAERTHSRVLVSSTPWNKLATLYG